MSIRGAEFRKADLQIHSPRDAGWEGARPEDALTLTNPILIQNAREAYCKSFITKCISEGLRAVAITDHHEGIYAYIAIQTKTAMEQTSGPIDLWIFPGMEITCKDSCQALVLFDADLPQVLFEKARGKLGLPADCGVNNLKGIQVELLAQNIEEVQPLLDSDEELHGRFIVLPHVKPSGHKTVLRTGFHKRFKDMPYVGGYMDKCYPHELNAGDRKILDGEIPAWSSEKRGVISTSDARHADFRDIGKHASWIKLASPTAESIRQAMLAPDSRIRHDDPKLPSVIISSVTVTGSKYLGNGTYSFNQQMNSIIGGRGAGKSTLLEYVRFALGCSAIDNVAATASNATTRLSEILEGTLDPNLGTITLDVLLNGATVQVMRQMSKRNVITVHAGGANTLSTVDDVRTLIPTQQYRQGELSDLAHGDAEKRLLDLITGQAKQRLSEVEAKLKKNAQGLSEFLAKAVRLSAARQSRSHTETHIKLLRAQIDNLKKQISTAGQAPTPTIESHDKYMRQQAALASTRTSLSKGLVQVQKGLDDFIKEICQLSADQPLFDDSVEIKQVFDSLTMSSSSQLNILNSYKNQISEWFGKQILQLEKAEAEWKPKFQQHLIEYEEQKKTLAGKQSVVENIEMLSSQERDATRQHEIAVNEETELQDADAQLNTLRTERASLQTELTSIVSDQLNRIQQASSGLAHGQLATEPDTTTVFDAITKAFSLPQMREARLQAILKTILDAENKSAKWKEIQDEMLELLKWKEGAPTEKGTPPVTPILQSILEDSFMERLREHISIERVSLLLTTIIRPRADIFHVRNGTQIEFRKASQGEQAASLLNILMNQSNGPLIIDQPEEDLDNKIINEIIRTISKTKDERQLILATHNANIVVNGDSENVIEIALGKQKSGGAIDEQNVRLSITDTMEGGKDAFELRRKKYNFQL